MANSPQTAAKPAASTSSPEASQSPDENVKLVAQAGTLPQDVAAPGATPPHPTSLTPDETRDTKEVSEARARIAEEQTGATPPAPAKEVEEYEPVECVTKTFYYDKRGALHQPGATVYYSPSVPNERFPIETLEPVDKAKAEELKKEAADWDKKKSDDEAAKRKRIDALADLANSTT